jgi:hypothetical protein
MRAEAFMYTDQGGAPETTEPFAQVPLLQSAEQHSPSCPHETPPDLQTPPTYTRMLAGYAADPMLSVPLP